MPALWLVVSNQLLDKQQPDLQELQVVYLCRISFFLNIIYHLSITNNNLTYKTLKSAAQRVDAAWAQVENQFQRRAD